MRSHQEPRSAPSSAVGLLDPALQLQNAGFFVGTLDGACYSVFSLEAVENRVCLSLCV